MVEEPARELSFWVSMEQPENGNGISDRFNKKREAINFIERYRNYGWVVVTVLRCENITDEFNGLARD